MRTCSPGSPTSDPFTLKSTGQFRTEGPYDLASPEWAAEFNEVKALGSNDPSTRTDEQNRLASFVSFNLFSAFNRTLREIAVANGLSTPSRRCSSSGRASRRPTP